MAHRDGVTVRMEYIGGLMGPILFIANQGREYNGGVDDEHRYADVFAEDVEHLEQTGQWKKENVVKPVQEKPIISVPNESVSVTPIIVSHSNAEMEEALKGYAEALANEAENDWMDFFKHAIHKS